MEGKVCCPDEIEHAVAMVGGLKQMRQEQELCDFIIKVQGVEYYTHRVVVALGSSYFRGMLNHDSQESREGMVEMLDVDSECVRTCIDFMYTGSFNIPDGKIVDLLKVAIQMQLKDVENAIYIILGDETASGNVYEDVGASKTYNLNNFGLKCKNHREENMMADHAHKERLAPDTAIWKATGPTEQQKLTVSLNWVRDDPDRKEKVCDLIKLIKLNEIPTEYLSDLLGNNRVVNSDVRIYKLISDPLLSGPTRRQQRGSRESGETTSLPADREELILFDRHADQLLTCDPLTIEVGKFHVEHFEHLMPVRGGGGPFNPSREGGFTAVSLKSYIYIICSNASVHRLNVQTTDSRWQKMANMISTHGSRPPCVSHSGSLYVLGDGPADSFHNQLTSRAERFDPDANNWSQLPDAPKRVGGVCLVSLGDSIYCIGGRAGSKNFSKFTPTTSKWVQLVPMNTSKVNCSAIGSENTIFVMGGLTCPNSSGFRYERGTKVNEVERYDVISGQWTTFKPMMSCHDHSRAHFHNGAIIMITCTGESTEVERYYIDGDRWSRERFNSTSIIHLSIYDSVTVQL